TRNAAPQSGGSEKQSAGAVGRGGRRIGKGVQRASCQTASLSSLAGRKATFLLALIWIGSPVAGLRPMRAARLRTTRMPRPPMRIRSDHDLLPKNVGFFNANPRKAANDGA